MNDFSKLAQELLNELSPKDKQDLKNFKLDFREWAVKDETKPLKGVVK